MKKSQSQKFKELAREAECDESEESFDNKLQNITSSAKTSANKKEDKDGGEEGTDK